MITVQYCKMDDIDFSRDRGVPFDGVDILTLEMSDNTPSGTVASIEKALLDNGKALLGMVIPCGGGKKLVRRFRWVAPSCALEVAVVE
jgi:hypothetical protein